MVWIQLPAYHAFCAIADISLAMAFAPARVLSFVKNSRAWTWYLNKVFGFTHETLSGAVAARWVCMQGLIGMVVTILAIYGWLEGTFSGA
jgi:hypothetical protein